MFYAYELIDKKEQGIVLTWSECKKKVFGEKARYKKFKVRQDAENWLGDNTIWNSYHNKQKHKTIFPKKQLQKGVYFDSGTGRKKGVEIRVTDSTGKDLLPLVCDGLTEFKTLRLDRKKTNNYGELLGLFYALKVAEIIGEKNIFGDSKLVLNYWSLGIIKIKNVDTVELSRKVTELRKEFQGKINYVSGDDNPADLGFHR